MKREDIYTVEGGQLVFNKEYIRGLPEFKVLLEKHIPSKGDADGRKKFEHWKIFMYIKIVADLFSYPNQGGYDDKSVHKAAIKESTLDENFKPNDEIQAAIVKYREIQLAMLPVLNTISIILKACKFSETVCHKIIESMQAALDRYNKMLEEQEKLGQTANVADLTLLVDGLITKLEQVNKLATNIPKTQDTLEKLDERLKKQSSGDTIGRGGKTIGNRADPKR